MQNPPARLTHRLRVALRGVEGALGKGPGDPVGSPADLRSLAADEFLGLLVAFGDLTRLVDALRLRLAGETARRRACADGDRDVAGRAGHPSAASFLAELWSVSPAAARSWAASGAAITGTTNLHGSRCPRPIRSSTPRSPPRRGRPPHRTARRRPRRRPRTRRERSCGVSNRPAPRPPARRGGGPRSGSCWRPPPRSPCRTWRRSPSCCDAGSTRTASNPPRRGAAPDGSCGSGAPPTA